MNKEEEKIISKTMLQKDRQFEIDVYKIIMSLDKDIKEEEAKKILIESLINSGRYKMQDIEKRRKELRKYTETFRKSIEEEQKRKLEKRQNELKAGKAIKAYNDQNIYLDEGTKNTIEDKRIKPINRDIHGRGEKSKKLELEGRRKSIIECVIDYITRKEDISNKQIKEEKEESKDIKYTGTLQQRIAYEVKKVEKKEEGKIFNSDKSEGKEL